MDSTIFAGFLEFFAQSGVIDFGLINEPRSPSIFIGAAQWICAHEIDVIRDDHQMAAREAGIDSARCVRQNESVAAESADHACAERDLFHRIAFVVVDTAFEDDNRHIVYSSIHDLPTMSGNLRHGKVRDRNVIDSGCTH